MVTWAAELAYKGTAFTGYAKQPGKLTVQGELEKALSIVFRREVPVVCAGRTDAGVHARGQWVSFQLSRQEAEDKGVRALMRAMNALTHEDISIRRIEERPEDFSARFDARVREYRYFIAARDDCPVLLRDICWHAKYQLDVEAMQRAAAYLVGEHDFKSFCLTASAEGKNTVRTVMELSVEPAEVLGEELLCIRVVGSAFLHSMVRTIVGTLVLVGRGKREPEWVRDVLAARSRDAAGETAPACGLVFWHVDYDDPRYMSAKERMAAAAESADPGQDDRVVDELADPGQDDRGVAELAEKLADKVSPKGEVRKNVVLDPAQLPASKRDGFAEAEHIRDVEMPSVLDGLDFSAFDKVLEKLESQVDEALKTTNRVTDPTDLCEPTRSDAAVAKPNKLRMGDETVREAEIQADPVPIQIRDEYMAPADPAPASEETVLVFENRTAAKPVGKPTSKPAGKPDAATSEAGEGKRRKGLLGRLMGNGGEK